MHIYYLTKISIRRCISKKHLCKILLCKKVLEISVITHLHLHISTLTPFSIVSRSYVRLFTEKL